MNGVLALTLLVLSLLSAAPAGAMEKIRVGVVPFTDTAPLFAAVQKGFFKAEDLEVEPVFATGGAAALPALAAGSLDIVISNTVSVLQAVEQGIDLRVILPASATNRRVKPSGGLAVAADGGVKTAKDLEGKRVAVNNLRNLLWLYTREYLERNGADLAKITFVEIPYPQAPDAIAARRVDAAYIGQPHLQRLLDSGKGRMLATPTTDLQEDVQVSWYVAMTDWTGKHDAALQRFARAYYKGVDFMTESWRTPEGIQILAGYTKQKPEVLEKSTMQLWPKSIPEDSVQQTQALMQKHGLLSKPIDLRKILHPTAVGRRP
jgi:NitT/TauT family transport system substrate-binding protein